jgi:hypothetical protein
MKSGVVRGGRKLTNYCRDGNSVILHSVEEILTFNSKRCMMGASGSLVVEALLYNPQGLGFETR